MVRTQFTTVLCPHVKFEIWFAVISNKQSMGPEDDVFVEEKFMEFVLVVISLFYFAMLIPTMVDLFEDKSLKERVIALETTVSTLEGILYDVLQHRE